ncbi:5-bromo-4-chloroindolyl phosphate hydrolysis family protein [Elioraea sp.]|uniref:5-bromo-4-chloroindolyl phosphate hydrolysis family protein n=1 Tax=Elioraea sp. TaxID=2185103 RepID=UPI0025BF1788|nr:5-bromo-4-chloroindolyl phosphate hydrolysis family protein [Elioraea sp.]
MISPPSDDLWERARRFRHGQRGWSLFVLSAPLIGAAITGLATGNLNVLVGAGGAWAVIVAGTIAARRGFAAEAEGRPAPRRFRSRFAVMVGAGTALAAYLAAGSPLIVAGLFGLGAAAGVRLLYGPDPVPPAPKEPEKPLEGDAAVIAEAKARITRLEAAAAVVPQRDFAEAIARIAALGRRIVAEAEGDPNDLRRARRFLAITLEGAEGVANRYVETHRGLASPVLEQNFRTLLADLEQSFAQQLASLKESDVRALDVDIAVLQQRLREEGMVDATERTSTVQSGEKVPR